LGREPLGEEQEIGIVKALTIISPPGTGTVTETLPVGFSALKVKQLRDVPAMFSKAIQLVSNSKYLGKTHPYLWLLCLNCADVAWGLGDRRLALDMGEKLTDLSNHHLMRKEAKELMWRMVVLGGSEEVIERLDQAKILDKAIFKPWDKALSQ
jgi:hypothetical protein